MTTFYDSTEFLIHDSKDEEESNKISKLNEFARLSTPKPVIHLGSSTEVYNTPINNKHFYIWRLKSNVQRRVVN